MHFLIWSGVAQSLVCMQIVWGSCSQDPDSVGLGGARGAASPTSSQWSLCCWSVDSTLDTQDQEEVSVEGAENLGGSRKSQTKSAATLDGTV